MVEPVLTPRPFPFRRHSSAQFHHQNQPETPSRFLEALGVADFHKTTSSQVNSNLWDVGLTPSIFGPGRTTGLTPFVGAPTQKEVDPFDYHFAKKSRERELATAQKADDIFSYLDLHTPVLEKGPINWMGFDGTATAGVKRPRAEEEPTLDLAGDNILNLQPKRPRLEGDQPVQDPTLLQQLQSRLRPVRTDTDSASSSDAQSLLSSTRKSTMSLTTMDPESQKPTPLNNIKPQLFDPLDPSNSPVSVSNPVSADPSMILYPSSAQSVPQELVISGEMLASLSGKPQPQLPVTVAAYSANLHATTAATLNMYAPGTAGPLPGAAGGPSTLVINGQMAGMTGPQNAVPATYAYQAAPQSLDLALPQQPMVMNPRLSLPSNIPTTSASVAATMVATTTGKKSTRRATSPAVKSKSAGSSKSKKKNKDKEKKVEKEEEVDPEEEKRKQFLERNRIAACKSRQKKKEWVSNLSNMAEDLTTKNLSLQNLVNSLREEIIQLRTELSSQAGCDCQHAKQFLRREQQRLSQVAPTPMVQTISIPAPPHVDPSLYHPHPPPPAPYSASSNSNDASPMFIASPATTDIGSVPHGHFEGQPPRSARGSMSIAMPGPMFNNSLPVRPSSAPPTTPSDLRLLGIHNRDYFAQPTQAQLQQQHGYVQPDGPRFSPSKWLSNFDFDNVDPLVQAQAH
ncbi:hypothetical protein BT69DRAFT_1339966 [Atractiella rhizophila]|nr:hypothetical protein BT69DRAFT_1339966 [Atractiella rhizophila]